MNFIFSIYILFCFFILSCKTAEKTSTSKPVVSRGVCVTSSIPFGGGRGSFKAPYLLCSQTHLVNIKDYKKSHFELSSNIDMADHKNWIPISNFGGTLNGNNFIIQNLVIKDVARDLGFLGSIQSSGRVIRLGVEVKINLSAQNIKAKYIAGIAGINRGKIFQSYSKVQIKVKTYQKTVIAGLVARNHGNIHSSFSTGFIQANSNTHLGGLIGKNQDAQIKNSYTIVRIFVNHAPLIVGGVAGSNTGTIKNTYALGKISVKSYYGESHIGSLVGLNFIVANIYNSYWITSFTKISKGIGRNFGNDINTQGLSKNIFGKKLLSDLKWNRKYWVTSKNEFPSLLFKNNASIIKYTPSLQNKGNIVVLEEEIE